MRRNVCGKNAMRIDRLIEISIQTIVSTIHKVVALT